MQQRALAFQPAPAQPQTTKTTDDEPIIVQTMPHQQQMLDAFATGNYHRLLDAIQDTELESCLEPKSSRILGYKDWRDDGTFLLAQLRHTTIRRILSNTFTQLGPQKVHQELRNPYEVTSGWDPTVNINYNADKDGNGVPIDDFEEFLTVLEVAAGLKISNPRFAYLDEAAIRKNVNRAYQQISKKQNPLSFFADLRSTVKENKLRTNVEDYCRVQRNTVLPLAKTQNATHLAIHGEVGISGKGYERCKQHLDLTDSSPGLLRLIRIVLRATFPQAGFRLWQHVVFHITQESQFAVGESIMSLLCASYVTSGGINCKQAGIPLGHGNNMTPDDWQQALGDLKRDDGLGRIKPNLERFRNALQQQLDEEIKQTEHIERCIEIDANNKQIDAINARLRSEVARLTPLLDKAKQQLDEAIEIQQECEQEEQRQANGLAALEKFQAALQKIPRAPDA